MTRNDALPYLFETHPVEYMSYFIHTHPLTGAVWITRNGVLIASAESISDAKAKVGALLGITEEF
jgi:hypothetical protein